MSDPVHAMPPSERWLYRASRGRLEALLCAAASAGWRLGARLHRAAPRAVYRAPCPVVSVGALAVGGAGKTPMALWCARELVALGARRVLVALRGHGRSERALVRVRATDATTPSLAELGDEASMLVALVRGDATLRAHVELGVGRRRDAVIRAALEDGPLDAVVLDDGLQHHRVARTLDLVLLDPACERHAVLPAGPLREPLAALPPRALLQVHAGDGDPAPALERVAGRDIPLASRYVLAGLYAANQERNMPLAALAGARLALVSAVGRNSQVRALLEREQVSVATHHARRDHAPFAPTALERLARSHDALLTTAKDWPRLAAALPRPPCPVFVARVELELLRGAAQLRAALAGLLA